MVRFRYSLDVPTLPFAIFDVSNWVLFDCAVDASVTEEVLRELFEQFGPLVADGVVLFQREVPGNAAAALRQ